MLGFLEKIFGNKKQKTQLPDRKEIEGVKTPTGGINHGTLISLWATFYYSKVLKDTKDVRDIPLLDMQGNKLGPSLKQSDWCKAGIEGTAIIDGVVYNYAGNTGRSQTSCSLRSTETVRWTKSPYKYGVGNKNNPLIPFYSIATDQKIIPFGTLVFIPEAVGVEYFFEDQKRVHDGFFRADDVGGAIKGNHIDVFIGNVEGGLAGASALNPFRFIKSNSSKTFEAFIVKKLA